MNRRRFLQASSLGLAATMLPCPQALAATRNDDTCSFVKPVCGTWFEFEHHNRAEGKYWDPTLPKFTTAQWKTKIREMYAAGMEYLVLLSVAHEGKTYYPSKLQPQHAYACPDPLEAILEEADNCGMKCFISNDFWTDWRQGVKNLTDKDIWLLREQGMEETAEKYAHHRSFYGWYYPHESELHLAFDDMALAYINRCSTIAHALTPKALTLIAPYGTRYVNGINDEYIRFLEKLDVDIMAYQDEVGVRKTQAGSAGKYYEDLYRMHVRAGRARLWADVEIFDFEGEVYKSALIPAPFERIRTQLQDVAPYVEQILIYQYLGMMNPPDSQAFAGHPDSVRLYGDYIRFINYKKQ
ncbi:MAG: DUF4434 domain-containing protein [Dysgonamonadaceae bacterium]|nr:DUF4434 domain-containing protein [Dysgonamonadaceae bacterium]